MSSKAVEKLRLGLGELARLRTELQPLIDVESSSAGVIERSAARAMLHSFYTEIEKLFKLNAEELDGGSPVGDSWHRDRLNHMAAETEARPAVIAPHLLENLREFLVSGISFGAHRFF